MTAIDFRSIVEEMCFKGTFLHAEKYGFGHINDTYAIYFKKADGINHRYILQRMNTTIFDQPEKLMDNIEGVTNHLKRKVIKYGGDSEREVLTIIPSKKGENFYKDPNGNCWRGYIFIEDATSHQIAKSESDFYEAAKAFGKFQSMLADYPAETLYDIIPNFHDTKKRYDQLLMVIKEDPYNLVRGIREEIDFIKKREKDTEILVGMLRKKELPIRVTHNDTKLNNVMIDNISGKGVCVIDLDTVMPGLVLSDFGDAIRFGASSALEDETDLTKVWMKLNYFEAFTKGYLQSVGDCLTDNEIDMLPLSAKILTLECGIRFLTDYLVGNTYFKINRPYHNLQRARVQLKLVLDMEKKMPEMIKIVNKFRKTKGKMNTTEHVS